MYSMNVICYQVRKKLNRFYNLVYLMNTLAKICTFPGIPLYIHTYTFCINIYIIFMNLVCSFNRFKLYIYITN